MDKVIIRDMIIAKKKEIEKINCYFCKLNRPIEAGNILIGNKGKMLTLKVRGIKEPEIGIREIEINYCPICGEELVIVAEKSKENSLGEKPL